MLRLVLSVLISIPTIIILLWTARDCRLHEDKYSEEERYAFARRMVDVVKKKSRVTTVVYGVENLPVNGGYVMYANHQGKYDSLGIIGAHEKPCTVLAEEKRSHLILADQFISIIKGARLDRFDRKKQFETILHVIEEVREGRRYIVFPEGGYDANHNEVQKFLPGAFNYATRSKSPIVPVALIDSYKVYGVKGLAPVETQVHFLKPMYFEEYQGLDTMAISDIVRDRIVETIKKFKTV